MTVRREAQLQWEINRGRRAWRDVVDLICKKDRLVLRAIDTWEIDYELSELSKALDRSYKRISELDDASKPRDDDTGSGDSDGRRDGEGHS